MKNKPNVKLTIIMYYDKYSMRARIKLLINKWSMKKDFSVWKSLKKGNEVNSFISFSLRRTALGKQNCKKNPSKCRKKGEKNVEEKIWSRKFKKKIVKLFFPIFQNFFRRKVQITHTKFYDHRSRGSGDTRGGRTHVTWFLMSRNLPLIFR